MIKNPVFDLRGLNVTTTSYVNEVEFRTALAGPKSWGVNTLIVDFMLEQDGFKASTIGYSTDPFASFDRTKDIVRIARDMGFDVWIKPLLFTAKSGMDAYQWHKITPDDPTKWFSSYESLIVKALSELEIYGVEALLLGNEIFSLVTDNQYLGHWTKLIENLNKIYHGYIGYNATAFARPSGLPDEFSSVTFLDQLDFIGLSSYPQLYDNINPKKEDMEAGWFKNANADTNIIESIRQFIEDYPNLKLAFTEFGAPEFDGGSFALNKIGWNVDSPAAWIRDPQEHALFFDVGFEVLSRELGDQVWGLFPFRWSANTTFGTFDVEPARGVYSFDLQGKLAESIIQQWFSGQKSSYGTNVMGSQGPDRIGTGFYNDEIKGGRGNDILIGGFGNDLIWGNGSSSSSSTIILSITASGAIFDGIAPIVEVVMNEYLVGIIDIPEIETYKTGGIQSWNGPIVYNFKIPSDILISDLKLIQTNNKGRGEFDNRNFYINSIKIDDVEISPLGNLFDFNGNFFGSTKAIFIPGFLRINTESYNDIFLMSKSDDDFIYGGQGVDISVYNGNAAEYNIKLVNDNWNVFSLVTNEGIDSLNSIERIRFNDRSIALDIDGNAGMTAKTLGAVFGKDAVNNKSFVGIGLHFLDELNFSYPSLMELAINARLGANPSNNQVVDLLYTNVVGQSPDAATRKTFTDLLDNGTFTVGGLGVLAADTELNKVNINLVGLAQTGLEYTPFSG